MVIFWIVGAVVLICAGYGLAVVTMRQKTRPPVITPDSFDPPLQVDPNLAFILEQAREDRALIGRLLISYTEPAAGNEGSTPAATPLDLPPTEQDGPTPDWTDELIPDEPPTWGGVATDLFGDPKDHPTVEGIG